MPGRRQTIAAGSYVRVPLDTPPELAAGLTIQAWVWPTTPDKPGGQGLVACQSAESRGFVFGLDDSGRLQLELGLGSDVVRVTHSAEPLPRWRWAFVAASYDPASGTVRLCQASAEPYGAAELSVHEQRVVPGGPLVVQPAGRLLLAARGLDGNGQALSLYNGKLDRPKLFDRSLSAQELEDLRHGARRCRPASWPPGTSLPISVRARSAIPRRMACTARPSTSPLGR